MQERFSVHTTTSFSIRLYRYHTVGASICQGRPWVRATQVFEAGVPLLNPQDPPPRLICLTLVKLGTPSKMSNALIGEPYESELDHDMLVEGRTLEEMMSNSSYSLSMHDSSLEDRPMTRIDPVVDNLDVQSLAAPDQLPLFPASGRPRLPIEICEYVIDWASAQHQAPFPYYSHYQETLCACTLVCRSWRPRARMYLFTEVDISSKNLPGFAGILRKEPYLSSCMNELVILCDTLKPISSLFITQKLQNLKILRIYDLDLGREHTWLPRSAACRSVKDLVLWKLEERKVSRFIRFLNSFHSLDTLEIDFAYKSLEYNGQILPKPGRISCHPLKSLRIRLVPGVSRLLDWFVKAGSFVACLKELKLYCYNSSDRAKFWSCLVGVAELLHHCSATIGTLKLIFYHAPMVNEISDLFNLESFSKLQELHYCASSDVMLKYMARQLGAVSSEVGIKTIIIERAPHEIKNVEDICGSIDSILTGDNFPSLARFEVPLDIFHLFPKLRKAGILERWSYS
ncbi:hypothetical protein QCA50_011760 [Cerrena zonata]|uniref:F-box domain-containing protein n=1 Tax=Cerrena zonata TaxID=2478898 RepID=A0AAW0G7F2_9APHY